MALYLLLVIIILLQAGLLVLVGGMLYAMRTGFNEVIKALEAVEGELERLDGSAR